MKPARTLRDQPGMTLVETVVASAIALVIVGVAATLLLSAFNVFDQERGLNEADQLAEAAYGFIEDCLDDALGVELTVAGDRPSAGFSQSIKVSGGRLYYNKGDGSGDFALFDETVYGGRALTYNAAITENDLFSLTVILEDADGTVAYRKDSSFRLMNVNMGAGRGAYDYAEGAADADIYFEANQSE